MQFMGSAAGTTAWATDGWDGIHQLAQHRGFMRIRCRVADRQGRATSVHDQMPLGPTLATIRRVPPRFLAPLGAGTLAASSEARSQSRWSAVPRWSSNTPWSSSQTPTSCQSRKRRQHVIPLPQPISCGSNSHWMPVVRTNRMPLRAARFAMRGRPPFGVGGSAGRSGSITAHSSSDTRGSAISPSSQISRFC
jgi:hypothetical protein